MNETTPSPSDAVRELAKDLCQHLCDDCAMVVEKDKPLCTSENCIVVRKIEQHIAPIEAERDRLKVDVHSMRELLDKSTELQNALLKQLSERDAQIKALRDALADVLNGDEPMVSDKIARDLLASTAPVSD